MCLLLSWVLRNRRISRLTGGSSTDTEVEAADILKAGFESGLWTNYLSRGLPSTNYKGKRRPPAWRRSEKGDCMALRSANVGLNI